jgi:hypothetical protein
MFKNQRCLSKNNTNCQPTCITNLKKKNIGLVHSQNKRAWDDDAINFNLAFWESSPTCGFTCKALKKNYLLYWKVVYIHEHTSYKKGVNLLVFGNNVIWNGECFFEKWEHVLKNEWLT